MSGQRLKGLLYGVVSALMWLVVAFWPLPMPSWLWYMLLFCSVYIFLRGFFLFCGNDNDNQRGGTDAESND